MPSGYAYNHASGDLRRDAIAFATATYRRWRCSWPEAMRNGWHEAHKLQAEMASARSEADILPELEVATEAAYRRPLDPDGKMRVYELQNELDAAALARRLSYLRAEEVQ